MPAKPNPTPPQLNGLTTRLIGAHMPTSGGICNSLVNGRAIGCSAVQVFTSSPRQWKSVPINPEIAAKFRETQAEQGIGFTVAHDSYLINLAASDSTILKKSREAFRDELDRAEALGIPWLVTHMGAHLDSPMEESMLVLCRSLAEILEATEGMEVGVALETTAGQGTGLGWRFEQIAQIINGCERHPRLGVCMDTCHIFVAGYDIRDAESYENTITVFDSIIGIDNLKVIHANDAKKPLGSRVDRHEHIGQGEIGIDAFARLVTDSRLAHVPIVVETPDADTMHVVNVERLRSLAHGAPA